MRMLSAAAALLFLIGYSAQKYLAAAPPVFVPAYAQTVVLIVFITAIIPFALAWAAGRPFRSLPVFAAVTGAIAVGASAGAFALYWYFTVSQYPNAPPVLELARRGLTPGLFIAAILVLDRLLTRRGDGDAGSTATPAP